MRRLMRRIRQAVRNVLVFAAVLLTAPLWLAVRIALAAGAKDGGFVTCSQILSVAPGLAGIFLRRGFYRMTLDSCSLDATVECGTWITHPQLRIANGVYIGGRCNVGMCDIGEATLIADHVNILSGRQQHIFAAANGTITVQGGRLERVCIGRNVWIGCNAVVMADVGDNTVIGAGSVVVKAIPANCVAVGNPCTVKRTLAAAGGSPPDEKV
jgi:virginiamycin A acetyltransferase